MSDPQNDATPASRRRFAREAGMAYKGNRDIYETAGYPRSEELAGEEGFRFFSSLYEREPLASRIVDMPATATWRRTPDIVEPEVDKSPFVVAFDQLERRLRVFSQCEQVDRLARIGRYGVMLIGVAGDTDQGLREPIPMAGSAGPAGLLYLSAFSEAHATVRKLVTDPTDPRYGEPESYRMQFGGALGSSQKDMVVHHSRVVHVSDDLTDNAVYGRPPLKRLANLFIDLQKYNAAAAESFWQLTTRILTGTLPEDGRIDDATRKAIKEAGEEIIHDLRRFIISNVDFKWLEGDPVSPMEGVKTVAMQLAAGAGIPFRILLGNETGERASSEDQRQWLGTIAERQKQFAEPVLIRPLLDRLIDHGYLPRPGGGGYDVVWPNLFEMDEEASSAVDLNRANAAKALTPIGGDPMRLVEVDDDGSLYFLPQKESEEIEPPPTAFDPGPPEAGPPVGDEEEDAS